MKNKKVLENLFLSFLALISVLGLIHLFNSVVHTSSFIDEDNFIAGSKNLIMHGNYSPGLETFFFPGMSVGFWSNFPSGIAASLGAEKESVRLVSFLFSLFMLSAAMAIYLFTTGFRKFTLATLTICGVGLFMGFIPYAVGSILTLGEIPALGYLGIGASLLALSPLMASFWLGVSVFGGKLVNIAFCVPILFFWVWTKKYDRQKIIKVGFWFIFPEILWITVVFICGGFSNGFQWIKDFAGTVLFLGSLAAGKTQARVPLLERFRSPTLEWGAYPLALKIKIILMLLVPVGLLLALCGSQIEKRWRDFPILTGLACGETVFAVWYFCLHPYMWIRHVQLAVGVGLSCLLWIAVQKIKKPKDQTGYYVTFAIITLLLLSRLK